MVTCSFTNCRIESGRVIAFIKPTSKAFDLCLQADHCHNKKHKIDRLGVNRLGNSDA